MRVDKPPLIGAHPEMAKPIAALVDLGIGLQ
jgi:hypothetical protein